MRLSTKSRYGTRAVLDIALQEKTVIPLKDIAKRQQLSLSYLEHLITPLIIGSILRSSRGREGGISLAKPPAEIKISEIIQILEGQTVTVDCVKNSSVCERSEFCVARDLWVEVNEAMDKVLQSTTIADLVERHGKKQNNHQ
jgi:Rrf2 family cysteine metabolism transcriptional repressor